MKNKGFTLVELIITIGIMAIVLMVAFPSVSKLQRTNKYKKMISYGEAMASSAKLYVDQYQEDLWGSMTTTGSRQISISTLKSSDLLKDYADKKDRCTSGYVDVVRSGSRNDFRYTYSYSLTCTISKKTVVCTGDSSTSRCVEEGREVYNSNS